jgi:spermidine/putrescine transport system ATP-binding protein
MVMSDRIAILNSGKFEQIGPAEEIYNRPKSRFVASFMGDVNLFDITMDENSGRVSIPGFSIADDVAGSIAVDPLAVNTLMVRPESVSLLQSTETADFVTQGKVLAKYMLGSRVQYEIEQDDKNVLIVETANFTADSTPGATVRLGFSKSQSHLISEAA